MNNIFADITLIKPAPNSSKLFAKREYNPNEGQSTDAIQEEWGLDELGREVRLSSSPYTNERFPGTNQIVRACTFDDRYNRWSIIDPEDLLKKRLLSENSDALNSLVEKCRLINKKDGHPERGKYITKADIYDRNDPFFTHDAFEYKFDAGEAYVRSDIKTNPLNVLILLGFIARKMFEVGSSKSYRPMGRNVKYIIIDKQIEQQERKSQRDKEERAYDVYRSLRGDDNRKLILAIALGHNVTTPEAADDILYTYSKDDVTKVEHNKSMSRMDFFLETVDLPKSTIMANYIFSIGVSSGVIKITNKTYNAFGESLGMTKTDAVNYFMRSDNDIMNRIEQSALEVRNRLGAKNKVKTDSFLDSGKTTQVAVDTTEKETKEPGFIPISDKDDTLVAPKPESKGFNKTSDKDSEK